MSVAQRWFHRFNTGEDLRRSGISKLRDIENIHKFLEENPQKVLVGCQKNVVHQTIPYIARFKHLKNHTKL